MSQATILTNQFLIAMPGMDDPNFSRSVTYICEHNEDGAMGVVINRTIDMELGEALRQLDVEIIDETAEHRPIYIGGPVHPERGFIVHQPHGSWDSTLMVTPEIAVTTSMDILNAIAHGYGPRDALFALGYAGWSAGQLESEMADNTWLTVQANGNVLFELPPEARWRAAAELIGIDPDRLSGQSGHA